MSVDEYAAAGRDVVVPRPQCPDCKTVMAFRSGYWRKTDRARRRIFVCRGQCRDCDRSGSNSYRSRLWKTELARLAADIGLSITVCHYPPGTSKWIKIEHRMFSFISMNWRGRTLTSYRVVVELIAAATTRSGLNVQAEFDEGYYPTGVKVSEEELAAIALQAHDWHTLELHAGRRTAHVITSRALSPEESL